MGEVKQSGKVILDQRDASTNKFISFEYKRIFQVIAYTSSCRRCCLTLYSLAQTNLEILNLPGF